VVSGPISPCGWRDWVRMRPGPVNSMTKPSPLFSVCVAPLVTAGDGEARVVADRDPPVPLGRAVRLAAVRRIDPVFVANLR
jgi:hypothetical protein